MNEKVNALDEGRKLFKHSITLGFNYELLHRNTWFQTYGSLK
jgi:hypothetical protein